MNERTPTGPLSITVPGLLATLLVFAIAAVCVRLGFWQLDRLEERRVRNAQVSARLEAPPVPLDASPSDTTGWLNRRVTLAGVYDQDRTILYAGRAFGGVPGVHVLAPLAIDGTNAHVLVNRGWLPAADAASPDLALARTSGPVRVTGIVVPFPGGSSPVPRGVTVRPDTTGPAFRTTWFAIDADAIRRQYPYALGSITIQLLPEPDASPWPARLPAPQVDQGPHLGYAVQWFSFALIAVVGWAAMVMKSRARTIAPSPPNEHS